MQIAYVDYDALCGRYSHCAENKGHGRRCERNKSEKRLKKMRKETDEGEKGEGERSRIEGNMRPKEEKEILWNKLVGRKCESEKEGGENNEEERTGERRGLTLCHCATCECKAELLIGQMWSSCEYHQ